MRPYLGLFPSQKSPLLVGVSGGRDSMGLVYLASRCFPVLAVIVDHALRSESSEEALITAERLSQLGIKSKIIRMNPDFYPKGGGTQERARFARFEVFHKIAKEYQINLITLAHHREDQDETLYMRWQKNSGKFGLAGILPLIKDKNLFVLRPLLKIPRARLEATLKVNQIEWCEDPSNQNRHYERVRVREDISEEARQKVRYLSELARCNLVFERYVLFQVWQKYFLWHEDAGWAEILPSFWLKVPKQTAITILRYLIQIISASAHPPSFDATARLYAMRFGTLGGVKLKKLKKKLGKFGATSILVREMRGLETIPVARLCSQNYEISALWSGTWSWEGENLQDPEIEVRPLGLLKEKLKVRDFPLELAQSLPSLWKGEVFLGAPAITGLSKSLSKQPFKWSGSDFLDLIGIRKI